MKYKSEFKHDFTNPEVVAQRCSVRKEFSKISLNSQENTCTRVSFLIKLKRLWHRCFIVNFTKFVRPPLVAASPNRDYLHCAVLKVLHAFQEKRDPKSRAMLFFLLNVPNEIFKIFKMFENNMKFTRVACWVQSKISNRAKNTILIMFLFCHYCCSLLWWNYWKSLKSDSHYQKHYFICFNESPLKLIKMLFISN